MMVIIIIFMTVLMNIRSSSRRSNGVADKSSESVLITGASSGTGATYADRFAGHGERDLIGA